MWNKFMGWFLDSETILIARLSALVGVFLQVMEMIDPSLFSPLIGDKWFPIFLIIHGVVLEIARRYRDPDIGN